MPRLYANTVVIVKYPVGEAGFITETGICLCTLEGLTFLGTNAEIDATFSNICIMVSNYLTMLIGDI